MSAIRHQGDLLILGAGPAGLSAAEVALAFGMRVLLIDQQPAAGGQLWRQGAGSPWPRSRQQRFAPLLAHPNLRFLPGHQLAMWCDRDRALLQNAQGEAVSVHAAQVLLASGARELVPPFPGWTLPGVTGAGGLQAMAKGGVDLAGQSVVLTGSGPLLLASAATLSGSGARVRGIFEMQSRRRMRALATRMLAYPRRLWEALQLRRRCARVPYECGWRLLRAEGRGRLEAALLADPNGRERRIACNRLGVSFGLVPNVESAAGLDLRMRSDRQFPALWVDAEQRCSVSGIFAAGEITGVGGGALAELEGRIAALAMVDAPDQMRRAQRARDAALSFAKLIAEHFACTPEMLPNPDPATIFCRCEDVPWSAALPGSHTDPACKDWRSLKLASRIGMGACQGRICGAIARAYGLPAEISSRPPVAPVAAATLAQLETLNESADQPLE